MKKDSKGSARAGKKASSGGAAERRKSGQFAWLGPMLERRKPGIEPVDPGEFAEKKKKK